MSRWPSQEARFWERVNKTPKCWVWTGAKILAKGLAYGLFSNARAHRFAYELLVAKIQPGLELDHICRNTLCIRPDHLEPVTHKENVLRGISPSANNSRKLLSSCGHPYTGHDGRRRYCKPCRTKWTREYYLRNSEIILARQKEYRHAV